VAICLSCGLTIVDGALAAEISTDLCQGLECRDDGLYAPCPQSIVGIDNKTSVNATDLDSTPSGLPVNGDATYNFLFDAVTITNTTCCTVRGLVTFKTGDLELDADAGFFGAADLDLQTTPPGGGLGDVYPMAEIVADNNGTGTRRFSFNGMWDQVYLELAAGASVTYQVNMSVHVVSGTGHLIHIRGGPALETTWLLAQVCC
jgi:hypothetical protein